MFSVEEIKESSLMRPGDELLSVREVCLIDKCNKKYFEQLLSNSDRHDLETPPRFFRDGFFPEGVEQASFTWTEEDGNLASLLSEPSLPIGQTSFERDLDAAFDKETKEKDSTYESKNGLIFTRKPCNAESSLVSSTSADNPSSSLAPNQPKGAAYKVDKSDPRSRYHYVKYVKRHGRTVKLWECGICGREFQHQYTLMRHLPTHTDERNYHCNACNKSFRQLSTLSQHRAIHSAERPYACEVCNKTFNRVSTLISHRKTHSDQKPYKCHVCPKGFHQKGNLRNHLFTHTNERPYQCNICMKGFNQQSNLVCHKNKAHPDENSTSARRKRNTASATKTKSDYMKLQSEQCEVTSSVEPHLLPIGSFNQIADWDISNQGNIWNEVPWDGNGMIVDAINTYHMGVAVATKQMPFVLLKADNGAPVLVKVVDAKIPSGKQMLVPAITEDLIVGGKNISRNEDIANKSQKINIELTPDTTAAQIRVPVVATVVPKFKSDGRLKLSVEEPHHVWSTMSPNGKEVINLCTRNASSADACLPRLEPLQSANTGGFDEQNLRPSTEPGDRLCTMPLLAPSPPLDLIPLDLFESMGCIPLGPQITTVDSIDETSASDDSELFIGKFEESILLSDSE